MFPNSGEQVVFKGEQHKIVAAFYGEKTVFCWDLGVIPFDQLTENNGKWILPDDYVCHSSEEPEV
jgi:hypothetical protein